MKAMGSSTPLDAPSILPDSDHSFGKQFGAFTFASMAPSTKMVESFLYHG